MRLMKLKRMLLDLIGKTKTDGAYDIYGRCQFKPGQALVFEPRWAQEKFKGGITYKNPKTGVEHPLKYGDIVHYLAEHSPAYGHCIVVDYDGKITTMVHPDEFRPATDEEV